MGISISRQCQKCIDEVHNTPERILQCAQALTAQKQYGEAVIAFKHSIALKPRCEKSWFGLANALDECGDYPSALKAYGEAISINPFFPEALYNRALLLNNIMADSSAAEAHYRRAIIAKPDFLDALNNLGVLLQNSGRFNESVIFFRKILSQKPDSAIALSNLGMVLCYLGNFEESISCFKKALSIQPDHAGILSNLGSALCAAGNFEEAIEAFRNSIALNKNCANTHCSLASALLGIGQLGEGLLEYQWRWQLPPFARIRKNFQGPQWRGEDANGRILLIWSEQGFGDTIQFCRYASLATKKGWRVVLSVQPALERLMRSLPGIERVTSSDQQLPKFDMHCPMMDLPAAFSTRLETIPTKVPYLAANKNDIHVWQKLTSIGNDFHLKVGLTWAGGKHSGTSALIASDRRRSIPPELFAPITKIPGAQFYSLQKEGPPAPAELGLIDLMDECIDFADTAALISNLDLVICVDTSVAHLAAALGKPVWMLNRFDSCWRWLRAPRNDSPWYPSLRLFRQKSPSDWESVIASVANELQKVLITNHGFVNNSSTF